MEISNLLNKDLHKDPAATLEVVSLALALSSTFLRSCCLNFKAPAKSACPGTVFENSFLSTDSSTG